MTDKFYSQILEEFYDGIGLECLTMLICAVVTSIGLFILTNKKLSKHPYPMIAYAMIASGAYMTSFSSSYWALNAYFYLNSPKNESWIILLFESSF